MLMGRSIFGFGLLPLLFSAVLLAQSPVNSQGRQAGAGSGWRHQHRRAAMG
jgi:hypothetical protein